jgi:predicted phosphodiesterase
MRLAVVSDIHGNLTALDAVAADVAERGVDRVVHGGDVALIGARPAEAIDRLKELGWTGIVGNTDELLPRRTLRRHGPSSPVGHEFEQPAGPEANP